jgi:hypothetical protein
MRLRSARPRNVMGSKRRMVEWSQYEVETKSLPWLAPRPHRVRQSRTGRRAPQQTRRPALVTLPTATAPDVDAFIRRWEAASGNELSNYQIFVGEFLLAHRRRTAAAIARARTALQARNDALGGPHSLGDLLLRHTRCRARGYKIRHENSQEQACPLRVRTNWRSIDVDYGRSCCQSRFAFLLTAFAQPRCAASGLHVDERRNSTADAGYSAKGGRVAEYRHSPK